MSCFVKFYGSTNISGQISIHSKVSWKIFRNSIYKSIILTFSVNLPLVFSLSFIRKNFKSNHQEILEQHRGEVRQGTLKLKFNISNHRNFSSDLTIVSIFFYS